MNRRVLLGRPSWKTSILLLSLCAAALIAVTVLYPRVEPLTDISSSARSSDGTFRPTQSQWDALTVAPVEEHVFRERFVTDGKIAVDEDKSTPVYSPYSGRVTKLNVKPGDVVKAGDLLFSLDATDTIQGQNDFIASMNAAEKAKSQFNLAQIVEARQRSLYEGKAAPLKDWQQSQADLSSAMNDLKSADTSFRAAYSKLLILGKTEAEIAALQYNGKISAETPIFSPIAGTVVQRRVGPGQYLNSGSSDSAYVIGDLSTVWLVANVREADSSKVAVGQELKFKTVAFGDQIFSGRVDYVSSSVDPVTRRLSIRATIDNKNLKLKPEMFASVSVYTSDERPSLAIPRAAVLYDGESARVWSVTEGGTVAVRAVTLGRVQENLIQVLSGLSRSEKIVVRGSLFIDRVASVR